MRDIAVFVLGLHLLWNDEIKIFLMAFSQFVDKVFLLLLLLLLLLLSDDFFVIIPFPEFFFSPTNPQK